jgi:hypothetical protein
MFLQTHQNEDKWEAFFIFHISVPQPPLFLSPHVADIHNISEKTSHTPFYPLIRSLQF